MFGKARDDDTSDGRYKVDLITQLAGGRLTDQASRKQLELLLNERAEEGWMFVPPAVDVNKSLLVVFERTATP